MNRLTTFQFSMALTLICAILMAIFLFRHRNQSNETSDKTTNKGIVALAGFNLLMGLWCGGHLSLSLDLPRLGQALLSLNPLMPTLFLHFAIDFVNDRISKPNQYITHLKQRIVLIYSLSILVVILSMVYTNNTLKPWLDFPWVLELTQAGWLNLAYTVMIGLIAHAILWWGYIHSQGNTRYTIILLFAAGAWGFSLATCYILPSLDWSIYPYPLWLMPSYLALITFAVLRYRVFSVNYWAIKTIIWLLALLVSLLLVTLLTSIASKIGAKTLSTIDLEIIWLYSIGCGLALWLLYSPLQRFASRLVYPDIELSQNLADLWLTKLNQSLSFEQLSQQASTLLSEHIHQPITVDIQPNTTSSWPLPANQLSIIGYCNHNQEWQIKLQHWQDTTPGIRHVGEIFASLLQSCCVNLEKSLLLAAQEKQRQHQLRLVELGSLSAAIAHELRNPLNIISMASVNCDDKTKQHIQHQLQRADTLIQDLLSYAKVIALKPQQIKLKPLLNALVEQHRAQHSCTIELDCDQSMTITADVHKLQQVIINCLDNACVFASSKAQGKVRIAVKNNNQQLEIAFHNNGPAISEDFKPQLFKPFISKRPGGSGLGLAIVQRIMEAHQGDVYHTTNRNWPVSFICVFNQDLNKMSQSI